MITAAALGTLPSTTTKLAGRPVYFMISATTCLPVPPPLDRSGGEKASGLPSYEQACSVAASSAASWALLGLATAAVFWAMARPPTARPSMVAQAKATGRTMRCFMGMGSLGWDQ
ncbi:hypothetical protein D3C72_2212310 [compost metagenome]